MVAWVFVVASAEVGLAAAALLLMSHGAVGMNYAVLTFGLAASAWVASSIEGR